MRLEKLRDYRRHGPGRKPSSWAKRRNTEGDVLAHWERAATRARIARREAAQEVETCQR